MVCWDGNLGGGGGGRFFWAIDAVVAVDAIEAAEGCRSREK